MILFFSYFHFFTLVFSYFYLTKGRAILLSPETTVSNFVYLMIFICNVFTHLYSEMSQDSPFHLKFKN